MTQENVEAASLDEGIVVREKDKHFGCYWHNLPADRLKDMELPTVPVKLKEWLEIRWSPANGEEAECAVRARTNRRGIPLVEITLQTGGCPIVETVAYNEVDVELHIFIETANELRANHPKWVA